MTENGRNKAITAVKWIAVVGFMAMGAMKLMGVDMLVQNFQRWGYPGWFLYAIGAVEVMGALGLVFERVRFQAAMVLSMLLVGAIVTHLRACEYVAAMMPAMFMALTLPLAWSAKSGCMLLSCANKRSSNAA